MINRAEWDSEFFGFEVGFCQVNSNAIFDINQFYEKANSYQLLYIMAEESIDLPENFSLVDQKTLLEKPINKQSTNNQSIISFEKSIHPYDDLLQLAFLSGQYSRFKVDKNITKTDFERLYKLWLNNSLSKKFAFEVLVKLVNNKLAGFVTLKNIDKKTSQIGLIAVNSDFQGRGIATELIHQAEFVSYQNGFENLQVPTQFENKPAMKLYQKNGFEIINTTFVYHFWNK